MSRPATLLLTAALLVTGTASARAPARYSADAGRVFWLLVVADSHVGASGASGDKDTQRLAWVTGEAYAVIRPLRVVLCGDLVDGSGTLGAPMPWTAQFDEEWTEYRQLVDAAGMTPSILVDLPGNHDQYGEKSLAHFLGNSVQGRADGQAQHSVVVDPGWGPYHLLAVNTAPNDGLSAPFDNAGLDDGEMAFIRAALDAHPDARMTLAFGHHPLGHDGMPGGGIGDGQDAFRALLKERQVAAYYYGHTHDYAAVFHDEVLQFNLKSLAKNDEQHVALVVVDNDSLATRPFTAGAWPYVVISAPADAGLGGGNPHGYAVPRTWSDAPVRAVVFAKDPVGTVEFRVDDGPWAPMQAALPDLYAATFDATQLAVGTHRLQVRAQPWPDRGDEIAFAVVADAPCSNGLDDDGDGLTDWPADPGCADPADGDETDPPVQPPDPGPADGPVEEAPAEPVPDAVDEALPEAAPDAAEGGSDEPAGDDGDDAAIPPDGGVDTVPEAAPADVPGDVPAGTDRGPEAIAPAPDASPEAAPGEATPADDPGSSGTPEGPGTARPGGTGGGCGCRADGGPDASGIAWLALAMAGAWIRLRRERRGPG